MTQSGSWGDCTFSIAEPVNMEEIQRRWWARQDATVRTSDRHIALYDWPPLGVVIRDPGDYVGRHRVSHNYNLNLLGGNIFKTNLKGGAYGK